MSVASLSGMNWEVNRLSGSLGVEVRGVDLSAMDDAMFEAVYALFVEHQVVCFRDQKLSPGEYQDFAYRWGEIHQHPFMQHHPEYPGILEILKTETDTKAFGNGWHSDQMFTERPAKCTMLHAKEVPGWGGDTMFSNMYDAYDTLSDGMKQMLSTLRGWNSGDRNKLARNQPRDPAAMSKMQEKAPPPGLQIESAHPLVRTHKDSGRKALYVGGHTMSIDGWSAEESEPVLRYLKEHSIRPEFTCRVQWEVDSLTIWDNRCVQHYAINDYPGERRRMHRITILGDEVPR